MELVLLSEERDRGARRGSSPPNPGNGLNPSQTHNAVLFDVT